MHYLGNNGLIKRAVDAKNETEIAEEKENIQAATVDAMVKSKTGIIKQAYLEESLKNNYDTITPLGEDYLIKLKNGKEYIVKKDGKVSFKEGVLARDIASLQNKNEFYGSVVNNYNKAIDTSLNDCWKIFYADENNIYLITDGYINTSSISDRYSKETAWKAYFGNIRNEYPNGIDSIGDTKYATLETIKKLNKDFYITKGYTATSQGNVRAISSMLDTNLWKDFMDKTDGSGKAQYAIGGPTIEMYFASYNQTHSTNYITLAFDTESGNNAYGYKMTGSSGGTNFATSTVGIKDDINNLYRYDTDSTYATTYWFASPSASNAYYMTGASSSSSSAGVRGYYSDKNSGFRPVVCLKSDVQLKKIGEYEYKIIE